MGRGRLKEDILVDSTYCKCKKIKRMAERVGFEPTVRFPVRSLSRRVLSTAQSPLRSRGKSHRSKASGFGQSRVVCTATGLSHPGIENLSNRDAWRSDAIHM